MLLIGVYMCVCVSVFVFVSVCVCVCVCLCVCFNCHSQLFVDDSRSCLFLDLCILLKVLSVILLDALSQLFGNKLVHVASS